jgi:hypothetical protein
MRLVAVAVVLMASACGGARALAPNEATAGMGGGASTGAAGATATGTAGATEGTGAGGSYGFSPTLHIPGADALERVAAVLWQQAPDGNLSQQAAAFTTTADVASIVQTMLADPRARAGVGAFYRWWLDLDSVVTLKKDPVLFPEATPELLADMANETTTFGVETTLAPTGTFPLLMAAGWTFVNARLAALYGIDGVTGDSLQRTRLPDGRAGLLTQPALQALGSFAARNSPSHRGTYIEQRFLCQMVPSSPPGVPGLPAPPPDETIRQELQSEFQSAVCAACHAIVDPPGLAFEGFDAIGRARTTDNGAPVDTSNLAVRLPDPTLSSNGTVVVVNGPVELTKALTSAPAVEGCFAQKWLSFALGRDLEASDMPSLASVQAAFTAHAFDLQALIVAVLSSDAFLAPP